MDNDDRGPKDLKRFAKDNNISHSFIKRAVSWGKLRVIRFGDRPMVPAEEQQRVAREGLPNVPTGYKRQTSGPVIGGRPRKPAAKSKPKPARRAGRRRGESHPTP